MKCPRCVQNIHRAAEECPHCGFSQADADGLFGHESLKMSSLTDRAGILRRGDWAMIEAAMERLTRRCPQVFAAIHTVALADPDQIRTYGFWLINRAIFEDAPDGLSNQCCVLLLLDPANKSAVVTYGYLLDGHLTEADTFECLSRGHAYWLEERYGDGMVRALAQLEKVLGKCSRRNCCFRRAGGRDSSPKGGKS